MNKDKKSLIILAGCVVIMVVVWVRAFRILGAKPPGEGGRLVSSGPVVTVQGAGPDNISSLQARGSKSAYSEWGPNPFDEHKGRQDQITLNGILWQEGQDPQAIINDIIVEVGSKIDDHVVTAIGKDFVTLNDGHNDKELRMDGVKQAK